jgi:kynureninase
VTGSPPVARDLASYRDEFEVVRRKAYLISASLGPVGDRSREYLDDYIRAWATKGAPDHVWFEDIFPAMARLKRSFAELCGCDGDEVALTTNVSIALSTVASALDLSGERNRIVLSELDFPTDGQVWQAWAAKTGAELVWLRSADRMTIPLERYDEAIDERTALVMVNRVLYRSSAVMDAKAICSLARERGALSLVDDYHGIGVIPLDLHDLGCDLYVGGTLKFLCGGPGCVFLYCRRDLLASLEPAVTGWFATAGDVVAEVGVDRIRQRQWELQERVIEHADRLGLDVRTPRERRDRGGVVNVRVGPDAERICHALLARDVCTDFRGDGLRISPHFFTNEDDVDRCFAELSTLVRPG